MNSNFTNNKFYMDIRLDFGEQYGYSAIDMDIKKFKFSIFLALKILHGEMGCIIPVDILKYREKDRRAFIRVPSKDISKVWSALTLFSSYEGADCVFRIYKVSPILACLNLNSNIYEHKIKEICGT